MHLGTAEKGACEELNWKDEIVVEPNFGEPRVLLNAPGVFAAGKLSVTLTNGMITNVNSDSASKAPELLKELVPVLKEVGAFTFSRQGEKKDLPACNAGPVIRRIPVSN